MSRGLIRSFVVVPRATGAEERIQVGAAAPKTVRPSDFGVEADASFLFKLRVAAGVPLRFLGRIMWFSPVILVAKLIFGAMDRRASDLMVPVFATLVTLFFASVCLWMFISFVWWLKNGRHAKPALVVGDVPEASGTEETFEGIAAEISPGSSVLVASGALPAAHFAQMEVFAVVRDGQPALIVVPERLPRVLGATESGSADLAPSEAAHALATVESPEFVVIRPGDRVRVRGRTKGDVANSESFEIDGVHVSLQAKWSDGAYRSAASTSALLVGDSADARMVIEKLPSTESSPS